VPKSRAQIAALPNHLNGVEVERSPPPQQPYHVGIYPSITTIEAIRHPIYQASGLGVESR
jgi:hypothetical protein